MAYQDISELRSRLRDEIYKYYRQHLVDPDLDQFDNYLDYILSTVELECK